MAITTTTMLPAILAALTVLIEDKVKRKGNGFIFDTVSTSLILTFLGVLELVLTSKNGQFDGSFLALFIGVMIPVRVFLLGNKISFSTEHHISTIQQRLEQILTDNKMEHHGSNEGKYRQITILNKYQTIILKVDHRNSDLKTIAFKGTWGRKLFQKISRELMDEFKGDLLNR